MVEVCPFKGNSEELSKMINESWADEHDYFIDYNKEHLQQIINTAKTDKRTAVGCYKNNQLIGFFLAYKIKINILENIHKAIVVTLVTTKKGEEKEFPLIRMWNYILNRYKDGNYDLLITFCNEKIKMNQIFEHFMKHQGMYFEKVKKIHYLIKNLEQKENELKHLELEILTKIKDADIEEIIDFLNKQKFDFSQRWDKEIIKDNVKKKNIINFVVKKQGTIIGFISGKIDKMKGGKREKLVSLFETFLCDQLEFNQKKILLKQVQKYLTRKRVQQIIIPDTGYFDRGLWHDLGFIRTFFGTNFYACSHKPMTYLKQIDSYYLEVV